MSDTAHRRHDAHSMMFGASLGIIGVGIAAFIIGAVYQIVAFRTSIANYDHLLVFTPVIVSCGCYLALLSDRRRRAAATILALFSFIGVAAMMLQSGWGEGIVDASPQRTKEFNQFTYTSDLLFCFAHAVQLAGAILIFNIDKTSCDGVSPKLR